MGSIPLILSRSSCYTFSDTKLEVECFREKKPRSNTDDHLKKLTGGSSRNKIKQSSRETEC